ncbi:MAG: bacillithiol biosynthesis cysteine-adding enzyme BshC [Bacteroidia bacterium]|nr:bacillithiol biosynthesis cysteine-adding enzyme BshC [Bacteroidia bacterium]
MDIRSISFLNSGQFDSLILDYLDNKADLLSFTGSFQNPDAILQKIKEHQRFKTNRNALVNALKEQYSGKESLYPAAIQHIDSLNSSNTFTITTGHQLCLFTGPLYFIYKIFSVINLAKSMEKYASELGHPYKFVPVYWMHTEDHDLAEINHFYLFGKKLEWQPSETGMAGEVSTNGLKEFLQELEPLLGSSPTGQELLGFFKRIYLENTTLGAATFQLANELFAEHGLVVLDPRHVALKQQFVDELERDIFQNTNYPLVQETNAQLGNLGYKTMVNPREINVFYTGKGFRERLVKKDTGYDVLNTNVHFSPDELKAEIHSHPERFSPNVVLRPMYQEKILPNVAYVGGAGELAYWMQYRKMFEQNSISFPVLWLRNSLVWIDSGIAARLVRLGMEVEDLFLPEEELVRKFVLNNSEGIDLNEIKLGVQPWLERLVEVASKVDKSLEGTAKAEVQKWLNGMENLETKMLRANKTRLDTQVSQLRKIKDKLFPGSGLQERRDNFANFYLSYGKDWFSEVEKVIQSSDKNITVVVDSVE